MKNIRLENVALYSNQWKRNSRYQIVGRSKVTRRVTFFVAKKKCRLEKGLSWSDHHSPVQIIWRVDLCIFVVCLLHCFKKCLWSLIDIHKKQNALHTTLTGKKKSPLNTS